MVGGDFIEINRDEIIKLSHRNFIELFSFGLHLPQNRKNERKRFIKLNGNYYFGKTRNNYKLLINELLGTYFSNLIGLDSVKNKVAFYKNLLFIISESFYKKGYEYYNSYDLGTDYSNFNMHLMDNFIYNEKLGGYNLLFKIEEDFGMEMLNDLLKLIILDLKMGQVDRHAGNITFCKNKLLNKYNLSPVYDFEHSYEYSSDYYENPLLLIARNENSLKELSNIYPFIVDIVNILRDIPIQDVLRTISRENGIKLSDDEFAYYKDFDKENIKVFERIR